MTGRPDTLTDLRKRTHGGTSSRVEYLTQNEVADKAGIDRTTYNQLEGGARKLSLYYAAKLEPILGAAVRKLVEETDRRRQSLEDKVGELEELVGRLATQIREMDDRVGALERPAPPKRATAKKKAAG